MASEYSPTTSQLFGNASTAISYASLSAGRISANAKPTLSNPSLDYSIGAKTFGTPPQFSDLFAGTDNTDAVIGALNDQVDEWLAKYFPSINAGFKNVPDDYLVGVISGVTPFGVDKTVFDLVWQQSRDRTSRTATAEQRQLEASFSSRGFSMPSGALVDLLAQSERRATDATLDVVREQAIKEADIKVDILKHAVGIAAQLKIGILNTSAEFFKAYYSVYGLGNDTARIRAQAYSSFYDALSSYYGVEVSWEGLRLRAAEATANTTLGNDRNKVGLYGGGDGVAQAHAQAARGFADVAASANAAAGTLVAQIESV